jgi:hypothetical protein
MLAARSRPQHDGPVKPRALRSLRRLAPALLLSLTASGCLLYDFSKVGSQGQSSQGQSQGKSAYASAMASAQDRTDDQMVASLERARARAKAKPGGVEEARIFAQNVLGVIEVGTAQRRLLDLESLLLEASQALDAAAASHPEQTAEAMFSKGGMFISAGKPEEGIAALRASMDAKPSPRACVSLIAELDKKGDPNKEIVPLCKKALPNAASDETRYALLDGCIQHTHAKNADDGLNWASAADIAFYKDHALRREVEQGEARREEQARSERRRAEMDASRARDEERRRADQASHSSAMGAPSTPSSWSLSLKNSCPKTVKLFLGNKPKFGSGTNTSLGSNTISSYSGRAGDMIWIVDDKENGISSLSPSGRQSMQITSSCTGFAPN